MTGAQLWPSLQGSGWLAVAQQAAMFLTVAQRAPEVEHTNSSLMSETLAPGMQLWSEVCLQPQPGNETQKGGGLLYHLRGQEMSLGNHPTQQAWSSMEATPVITNFIYRH